MSFLGDLLTDMLTPDLGDLGLGPSSPRGMLWLGLLVGLALSAANGWLLVTAADPLREPSWGIGVIGVSFVLPPVSIILGLIHFTREPYDRVLTLANLVANVLAIVHAICALV